MTSSSPPSTAVVTGSSRGIGRAIALELAAQGTAVVVHGRRDSAELQAVAGEIRRIGVPVLAAPADLGEPSQREAFVRQAWEWRGGIDGWVNNAGVDILTDEAAAWSFDRKLEMLLRVDVTASISLGRAVGSLMKKAGRGAIVNVGWDGTQRGMEGDSGQLFAAAKGAVTAFTRSLAQSLAPEVRVNCVAPGWIKTAWGEDAGRRWQRRAVDESLRGRWGDPQDVAAAVRFLLSSDADFINGQILDVNGGFRVTPTQDRDPEGA